MSEDAKNNKDDNAPELYRRYRPKSIKAVLGQDDAIRSLVDMVKRDQVPHCLLFTGPSGTGKTSLARIVAARLGCTELDFEEINAAQARGIDTIRDVNTRMRAGALGGGKCRVYLFDEAHRFTGDASDALLKMLEDTPYWVYFILATTDPGKLKATIKTRCTEIRLKALTAQDIKAVVNSVVQAEGKSITDAVLDKIVEVAAGSARAALVALHSIIGLPTPEQQLAAINVTGSQRVAYDLCQALFSKDNAMGRTASVLQGLEGDDWEGIRWAVLGYARAVLVKSGLKNEHAAKIISRFQYPFYESKGGGLALACFEVLNG